MKNLFGLTFIWFATAVVFFAGCKNSTAPAQAKRQTSPNPERVQPSKLDGQNLAKDAAVQNADSTRPNDNAGDDTSPVEVADAPPSLPPQPTPKVYERPIQSWKGFLGDDGKSTIAPERLTQWSADKNIAWTSELPGRGSSSPIVINNRIYVTAASGYGESAKNRGKIADLKHHVMCFDAASGKLIWQRDIKGSPLTMRLNENLLRHGFASSTPVTDGKAIYTFFGPTGVFAFDLDGTLKWQADVGFGYNYFGSSASLVLYDDLLIINASIENRSVYALNKYSGRGIWRVQEIDRSWSMPVIGQTENEDDELIIMEEDFVRGYDPLTGEELWHCDGVNNYVVATPTVKDGIAYCNGGIERQMMAIKLGGRGNVSESHKLWEVPLGANVSSPIIIDDRLYLIADNGIMQSFLIADGSLDKRHRLPTKSRFYATPLLAGNKFYIPLEDNGVYVCEANPDARKLSNNQFDPNKNSLKASFACWNTNLILRNDRKLYSFGETESRKENKLEDSNSQSELIVPTPSYEFEDKTGRIRVYNLYLDHNHETCKKTILAPYRSVITEDQTTESYKIIEADYQPFLDLRQRQDDAYWEYLKGTTHEELLASLKAIDKETTDYANKVRIKVKKLFSKEQMDQHLKEAAERRAKIQEAQKQK